MLGKRNLVLVRPSASDAQYFHLLQAGYTRSTFTSDTQMVVAVINTRPRLMRISYMKSILGGPWLSGAQGSRLPLPNGKVYPCYQVW